MKNINSDSDDSSVNLNAIIKPVKRKTEVGLTNNLYTPESKTKNIVSNKTDKVKIETLKPTEVHKDVKLNPGSVNGGFCQKEF